MKKYRLREKLHENLLDDLLLSRGVAPENHEQFLNPDFERDSHDPFLLPDMEQSVERILSAKKNNEKVAVWSDYDCDGIPGGVMLAEFLRDIGLSVTHYIPHRHEEGYGLNKEGLDELSAQGVTLVITVDLGTTDHECVLHAKNKKIDAIITDHHLIPQGDALKSPGVKASPLPDALVINPKREDSRYPFPDLCGAGVAWKLVQAILSKNRSDGFAEWRPFDYAQGKEKWLLDLVGLATLSDMVPLRGENRMLAHFGLRVMRRARRPGLASLCEVLRIKPASLTEDDVGFMISPRINAASRMGSPESAARLLGSRDPREALFLAGELNKINDERKGAVASVVKEINKRLLLQSMESPVIVMGSPNWRPGILGLVANSLSESHQKPVCLWGREGGEVVRGSCRAQGVSVVEWMSGARDLFDDFGGHRGSGGFSLPQERVHELSAKLASSYSTLQAQGALAPEVTIDRELDIAEVKRSHREVRRLSPFGVGFEKPLFVLPGVSIGAVRVFGKQQNHLELRLLKGGYGVSGISFFAGPDSFSKKAAVGERADVVGNIESDWLGNPRLRVVDII